MSIPAEIALALNEEFLFPEKPLFGAVATVHGTEPRVRTMRVYDITPTGYPVLLTHTDSSKWNELLKVPYATINMVSESKLVQMTVRGKVQLVSDHDKRHFYWNCVRPDVKKIYDPRHSVGAPYDKTRILDIPDALPETFGMASVLPDFWELLRLDKEYTQSQRYQFHWIAEGWQKQRIQVG